MLKEKFEKLVNDDNLMDNIYMNIFSVNGIF